MKPSIKLKDKLVRERTAVLKASKEFAALKRLVPTKLRGKEAGVDFDGLTSDREIWRRHRENTILLSQEDMERWGRFSSLCDKVGQKYHLASATVMDMAMGVKRPLVPPRPFRVITGNLDPVCLSPQDFDPRQQYSPRVSISPGFEAIEIMRLVQALDEETKEEVKTNLLAIAKHKFGYRMVELVKECDSDTSSKTGLEIDVCMRIPTGCTAKEVSEVYRNIDRRRRDILTALRIPVPKRCRESKALQRDVKKLKLGDRRVRIYDIVDEQYHDEDTSNDQKRRKSVINRRHKERRLLERRYPGWQDSAGKSPS